MTHQKVVNVVSKVNISKQLAFETKMWLCGLTYDANIKFADNMFIEILASNFLMVRSKLRGFLYINDRGDSVFFKLHTCYLTLL